MELSIESVCVPSCRKYGADVVATAFKCKVWNVLLCQTMLSAVAGETPQEMPNNGYRQALLKTEL